MELTKTNEVQSISKGFKQTEVGMIPEDWVVQNLANNSTLKARIGWQGLTTAEYLEVGEYYLITGTDFKDGRINWEKCHFVKKERFDQDKNIQISQNDILITKDGTIGKVALVDEVQLPTTLNSGVFVIRPKKSAYDPTYVYNIFRSNYFEDFLNKLVAGSTISHLYQKDFVTFNFPLPPTLTEQTAIATALSDADAWINSLEKLIAKKRLVKQGAMQELLKPKEGWEVKSLSDVAEYKNGAAHENCVVENGDYIIVNSKFVSTEGKVKKYSNHNLCPVYKNEILMVLSDVPNGKAIAKCFYVEENNKYTLNQRICSLKSDKVDSKFLFLVLNRNPYYLQFDDGVKQTNLRNQDVLSCPIWLPESKLEQTRIASILSDMDAELDKLEEKLAKAKQVKQGMMQELLTGRIRLV